MVSPRYMTFDYNLSILFWTDISLKEINFDRYGQKNDFPDADVGLLYQPGGKLNRPRIPTIPVGLAIDRGLGAPTWGTYLDCYGNGYCLGPEGNTTLASG